MLRNIARNLDRLCGPAGDLDDLGDLGDHHDDHRPHDSHDYRDHLIHHLIHDDQHQPTRAASQGHSSGSAGRPPTILVWNRFAFVPHSSEYHEDYHGDECYKDYNGGDTEDDNANFCFLIQPTPTILKPIYICSALS